MRTQIRRFRDTKLTLATWISTYMQSLNKHVCHADAISDLARGVEDLLQRGWIVLRVQEGCAGRFSIHNWTASSVAKCSQVGRCSFESNSTCKLEALAVLIHPTKLGSKLYKGTSMNSKVRMINLEQGVMKS